ncbi:MAG: four helix bundle protein [Anaerolineae bacterium]|nr:four helix bundle protein [Anaerolineae bacterium]
MGEGSVREPARRFDDLVVWQKAHQLVLDVYAMTEGFPKHELFGLTSQVRRAAVSVPANIAEGFRRRGHSDKVRFLNIAQASLEECRYYFILARDLNYCQPHGPLTQLDEVSRLLDAYIAGIHRSRRNPP